MNSGLFFLAYTRTPLHAGIGQSIEKVDLPIEREKHTTYPCVYASGLKGALKVYCKNNYSDDLDVEAIFGKENDIAGAGGAIFTDLKILLFPVRASHGAFKWVTCQHILKRLKNDYLLAKGSKMNDEWVDLALSNIVSNAEVFDPNTQIILEDYLFERKEEPGKFLDLDEFPKSDIYLIDEELFKYLVNNATQIIARNQLNEKKISENLWYEEALPSDTLMYSFIMPSIANETDLNEVQNCLDGDIVQIGGNETVGHGLCELNFL